MWWCAILLLVLNLVLHWIAILLRVEVLAIGHSCHAILILETSRIHVHLIASLSATFVVVQLAHQETKRSDQREDVLVVGLVDVLLLLFVRSTIPTLLKLFLTRLLRHTEIDC